ncbi:hypothetical protein P170DRAFT_436962 [Aspergillus steynii IBT 23096]|uniref:Uncharacterized protein n=1 Tax=Aspergillus steynii IBT 23096 TaxID=1392250 RepID=A0A2I2G924_9EURO|nr:uncharacterized protein P170DRAFT_436962 [Aspergillus steynii IBT 23096]PLB49382.1 hypothetical protein P170DRAFT_436962 [Aspergillus steynii IBT 23096]
MSIEQKLTSSQSQSNKRARLLIVKPSKPRPKRSRLEALPVELIEKIFLYSLNANLPRASPSLAAAVSSERIYRALVLLAFWNDTSSSPPNTSGTTIAKILRPLDYVPLDYDERKALQISIMRCKWCTVDRLLSQLPNLMNLTIQRHWVNAGMRMTADQEAGLARFLSRQEDLRTFEGTGTDNAHYTLSITPLVSIRITCHETDQQQTHQILGILDFPQKLLSGGGQSSHDDEPALFTRDHVACLEILRVTSGFARPDLIHTGIRVSREATQAGIHAALVENNERALATLLKIDEYVFRSENTSVVQAGPDNDTPPYTLPAEHYRTAVRVARHDPSFFQLLLRASTESIPADDSEITEWAMGMNDSFGHWLLDLMLHLPQRVEAARANPAEGAVFYLGRANGQVDLARRYLRDVLGVEELGSWMEESEVDVEGLWTDGSA